MVMRVAVVIGSSPGPVTYRMTRWCLLVVVSKQVERFKATSCGVVRDHVRAKCGIVSHKFKILTTSDGCQSVSLQISSS